MGPERFDPCPAHPSPLAMHCRFCRSPMAYVHGHAACVDGRCPMFGVNQAECCDGETIESCPVPTAELARGPVRPRDDD